MKLRLALPLFGVVWVLAVTIGLGIMLAYEETPGIAASPSVQWPAGSRIEAATDRATLVMLAHPRCPCTRASIGELNALMARCHDRVKVYVLFMKPKGFAPGWEKSDLWRSAAAIPDVNVLCDEGGLEGRRFDATTSGHTLLFDNKGNLLFSGGITGGRGHSGDNLGRDTVVSLLTKGEAENDKTPVFGCALVDSIPNNSENSPHATR